MRIATSGFLLDHSFAVVRPVGRSGRWSIKAVKDGPPAVETRHVESVGAAESGHREAGTPFARSLLQVAFVSRPLEAPMEGILQAVLSVMQRPWPEGIRTMLYDELLPSREDVIRLGSLGDVSWLHYLLGRELNGDFDDIGGESMKKGTAAIPLAPRDEVLVQICKASPDGLPRCFTDDTGFPKQGEHSVGVARQYTGTLGKVASCQVAVTLQFAAATQVVALDARLYLTESWTADRERRTKAGVPDAVGYQPKWQMALTMLRPANSNGLRGVVLADSLFGTVTEFRQQR